MIDDRAQAVPAHAAGGPLDDAVFHARHLTNTLRAVQSPELHTCAFSGAQSSRARDRRFPGALCEPVVSLGFGRLLVLPSAL